MCWDIVTLSTATYKEPYKEDWKDVQAPVDDKLREKITELVDKLGQGARESGIGMMGPGQRAATDAYKELIDIGEPASPFLIKGLNSANDDRATQCAKLLIRLGRLPPPELIKVYKKLKQQYQNTDKIDWVQESVYFVGPPMYLYNNKTYASELVSIYHQEKEDVPLRYAIINCLGRPSTNNRSIVPFLIKISEEEPDRVLYTYARIGLLHLTGLFLHHPDEEDIVKRWITGGQFPTFYYSTKGLIEDQKYEATEKVRPIIIQMWQEWYQGQRHNSSTEWLKHAFDRYTQEIDNTWLLRKSNVNESDKRLRMMSIYCNLNKYEEFFEKSLIERLQHDSFPPDWGNVSAETWDIEFTNGSAYRKWWEKYGAQVDFVASIASNPNKYDLKDLYYLCDDPRIIPIIIGKLEYYKGFYPKIFDSKCRYADLDDYSIDDKIDMVNEHFQALKDLTGQDFGWDWRKTKEEKAQVIEQWVKWVNENVSYLYWTDKSNQFIIDQEAKAAGILTDEYRKTHPWPKEENKGK